MKTPNQKPYWTEYPYAEYEMRSFKGAIPDETAEKPKLSPVAAEAFKQIMNNMAKS